ncbi:killer cell lectin-like receptor subfamily F member 1 [Pleurodeles waltl]|uniref:killer cell lectin-like receptor subfamily F member 1 n=1 Tax=Pleurodeles waltl TaxID=8319 RepID=UPI0037097B60
MCPGEWLMHGGKCYYFSSELKNWTKSHEYCSSSDSHLAVIKDKAELDFLSSKIYKYHWIGFFNTAPGRCWTWVNGSALNETLFTVRGSAEGDRCGSIKITNLESSACINELRWICEKHAE